MSAAQFDENAEIAPVRRRAVTRAVSTVVNGRLLSVVVAIVIGFGSLASVYATLRSDIRSTEVRLDSQERELEHMREDLKEIKTDIKELLRLQRGG